jgi:nitrite reductase/ring-hydroxylating ferredoxin subunit
MSARQTAAGAPEAPTDAHFLCRTDDIPASGIRAAVVPGYEPLAVCKVGDRYYLISDMCTHAEASLSEGEILDGQVMCPYHGGTFDPATGEATGPPCTLPIRTYKLLQMGESLYLALNRLSEAPGACRRGTE